MTIEKNNFALIMDKARQSTDKIMIKLVTKIDSHINLYKALTQMQKLSLSDDVDSVLNIMAGYDRGLDGVAGYSPIFYGDIVNPYKEKQEILKRITILFEVVEETILEEKGE